MKVILDKKSSINFQAVIGNMVSIFFSCFILHFYPLEDQGTMRLWKYYVTIWLLEVQLNLFFGLWDCCRLSPSEIFFSWKQNICLDFSKEICFFREINTWISVFKMSSSVADKGTTMITCLWINKKREIKLKKCKFFFGGKFKILVCIYVICSTEI